MGPLAQGGERESRPQNRPMPPPQNQSASRPELRLAELLSALSYALDMVEGQPAGHCVRCCWIGIHIGREIGLRESEIWELYYTLLMKDVGCSSNAARICQLYMTDDIAFKRDFMTVNGSLPQVLRFVLSHTGMNSGLAERFRALVHIFQNGGQIAQELTDGNALRPRRRNCPQDAFLRKRGCGDPEF
jgi:hypothetical protein